MKDPREYLDEIRRNEEKIRAQPLVTPAENALFGLIDGLGGLLRITMSRVTELERRLGDRPEPPELRKRPVPRPRYPQSIS